MVPLARFLRRRSLWVFFASVALSWGPLAVSPCAAPERPAGGAWLLPDNPLLSSRARGQTQPLQVHRAQINWELHSKSSAVFPLQPISRFLFHSSTLPSRKLPLFLLQFLQPVPRLLFPRSHESEAKDPFFLTAAPPLADWEFVGRDWVEPREEEKGNRPDWISSCHGNQWLWLYCHSNQCGRTG